MAALVNMVGEQNLSDANVFYNLFRPMDTHGSQSGVFFYFYFFYVFCLMPLYDDYYASNSI